MLKISTPFSQVDTELKFALGSRTSDRSSNEYIYLQGTAGITTDDLVRYDNNFVAQRAIAGLRGPLAVTQGSIVASRYGWCKVKGLANIRANGAIVARVPLFLTAGSGAVDDAIVAGDLILGAFSSVAGTAAAGTMVDAVLSYPFAGSLSVAA